MQLKNALKKVRSTLHFNRLARVLGVKKISYKQDLFSNQYHDKYIKYSQLPDYHLVVRSHESTLFGGNGGLPSFILDWLKEAYLKSNRAYLRFLAIFDDTLVKQAVHLDSYRSIVFRAEACPDEVSQLRLEQSYFQALTEHYQDMNMVPATLLTRAEGYCLQHLKLLLSYYFPYKITLLTSQLEKRAIPQEAQSRLGRCQLGQGAVLGKQFVQLGRTISVVVEIESAHLFSQIEQQAKTKEGILQSIKLICNHYVNHEVVVKVEAEYTGLYHTSLQLTENKQRAVVLGVNGSLAAHNDSNKRTVRAL